MFFKSNGFMRCNSQGHRKPNNRRRAEVLGDLQITCLRPTFSLQLSPFPGSGSQFWELKKFKGITKGSKTRHAASRFCFLSFTNLWGIFLLNRQREKLSGTLQNPATVGTLLACLKKRSTHNCLFFLFFGGNPFWGVLKGPNEQLPF